MKSIIHLIAGARPNFMKVAPIYRQLRLCDWAEPVLIHTGQHYSSEMSDVFFSDLNLPSPDHYLDVVENTHAKQTSSVMLKYEQLCLKSPPDLTLVVGDVNSTLAATLTAKKMNIPVAHVEAGLRSGDRSMPEEINRLVVDSISDLHLTPSDDADLNLINEGIPDTKIFCVGNVMIDSYCYLEDKIERRKVAKSFGVDEKYIVVTLHRPKNVDVEESLSSIVDQICELSKDVCVVFPVHPRTRKMLEKYDLLNSLESNGVKLVSPLGYVDFMSLVSGASLVVTDSGGVQEETSYLGIRCLTVRDSTERPVTISKGTNKLIAKSDLYFSAKRAIDEQVIKPSIPLWDGFAAKRVAECLRAYLERVVRSG